MPNLLTKYTEDYNRPWGGFTRYTHNELSTVKVITVNPGQELSYQWHHQRSEIWIVLDAGLTVKIDDQERTTKQGEIVEIPQGTKHQAKNTTEQPVRFLEIALGNFDESDIVRLNDRYGRT